MIKDAIIVTLNQIIALLVQSTVKTRLICLIINVSRNAPLPCTAVSQIMYAHLVCPPAKPVQPLIIVKIKFKIKKIKFFNIKIQNIKLKKKLQ